MKYKDLFTLYKPSPKQVRLMRVVALLIFTMLLVISYAGYGCGTGQYHRQPAADEREISATLQEMRSVASSTFANYREHEHR
jgi:uncharacterized MAPEG superfamily protein